MYNDNLRPAPADDTNRKFWKYLVFGVLTLGIYDLFFMHGLIKDMNRACSYAEGSDEDNSPSLIVYILLTAVTFGIYNFFWYYKQGDRLRRCGRKYGIDIDDKGSTYLLWMILGSLLVGIGPLIATYMLISNCNKVCRCYNSQIGADSGDYYSAGSNFSNNNNYSNNNSYSSDTQRTAAGGGYLTQNDYPNQTEAVSPVGTLRFTKGSMSGAEIQLRDGEEVLVGRSSEMCQMVLGDRDISHRHCAIRYSVKDACYYVTDYSSLGTFMNGSNRIPKNVAVRCPLGTKLTLGSGSNEIQLV